MEIALYIGYVFGSIQDIDLEGRLGWKSNKWSSEGIWIRGNGFYLYDGDHSFKRSECESEDGPSTFPEQGQYWRVSWDLTRNEMEISVLNQQETVWIPMTRHAMKQWHCNIIPGFTLRDKGDSITLLSE